MYETYYGFAEKPFSLTPDPKYLYRSQSHANAFELLQYAIRRREGFAVVTGDIGTGKTTLCRALLEEIDRTTFTALVLNPFLSEEDLLKRILQDFGVVSRENIKAGRLAGVTKQDLIETLYDFLLGLIPLKANAVLIIDEAQNLPLSVPRADPDSVEPRDRQGKAAADHSRRTVEPRDAAAVARAPAARSAGVDSVSAGAARSRNRRSVRRASPHDRRRVGGRHVCAQGAGSAAPPVGRHSAPHQSDLRPRAAGGIFGPREPHHARHGGPRGREPRRAAVATGQVCAAGRLARRRGGGRARRVRVRGRVDGVSLSAIRGPDGSCGRRRSEPVRHKVNRDVPPDALDDDSRGRLSGIERHLRAGYPRADRTARDVGLRRLLRRCGPRPERALATRARRGLH